jgi:hypothetical protein
MRKKMIAGKKLPVARIPFFNRKSFFHPPFFLLCSDWANSPKSYTKSLMEKLLDTGVMDRPQFLQF